LTVCSYLNLLVLEKDSTHNTRKEKTKRRRKREEGRGKRECARVELFLYQGNSRVAVNRKVDIM
jgi:hypothetical protein